MFCDNESVYKNLSTPKSTLKEKDLIILYYKCREAVAAGLAQIDKEGMSNNLAGLFTKILVHIRRETFLDKFTYWFIFEVVLFERWGFGFIPKKGLPLPPYQGVAYGCGFAVRLKSIRQYISIAHPKNHVEGTKVN